MKGGSGWVGVCKDGAEGVAGFINKTGEGGDFGFGIVD